MPYETRYAAFVARSTLSPAKALALAGAGLGAVILQVEWQRSTLTPKSVEQLRAEHRAARAAGLEVWWWGWVCPTLPTERGRRPSGARALADRLDDLVSSLGSPAGFIADCEAGGRWSRGRLGELPMVAAAARAAGMPIVGLTSHGILSRDWAVSAFDYGMPQLYDADEPLDVGFCRRCLATWDDAPTIWIVLGCADAPRSKKKRSGKPRPMPVLDQMRGDLETVAALGVVPTPGACWWTARQLRADNGRLAAAVP